MPAPETTAEEVIRKRPRRRWALGISLGILLAASIFAFQPLVTAYCWLTETPRTQFKWSSEMREPIRTLFADWETADDVTQTDAARKLVGLIGRDLPRGSTLKDVDKHIREHYRKGVQVQDWHWPRSDSEGVYTASMLDMRIVTACGNPRDFLEGGTVKVHYVTSEDAYLRTEIKFVGWKGHRHPQVIKIIAVEEPNDGEQGVADEPAAALNAKTK
jgi:hypothetical protein